MEKIIKEMNMFRKTNKVLFYLLIISILIYISYYFSSDLDEWFPGADFIYKLGNDLSLAYMGSFVFYIVQVYIPEVKNKKILNENIKRKLFVALNRMETLIKYLSNTYISKGEIEELTNVDCKEIIEKMNISEEAPMIDSSGRNVTLLRYIKNHVFDSEKYINDLYDTMILYLEPSLIEILDNIKESAFNCFFKTIPESVMLESNDSNGIEDHEEENFIYQYCKLYLKLKQYYDLL